MKEPGFRASVLDTSGPQPGERGVAGEHGVNLLDGLGGGVSGLAQALSVRRYGEYGDGAPDLGVPPASLLR